MARQKEEIAYYVKVGRNGIGYETRCDTLAEARQIYKFRKSYEDEVTLTKYNFTRFKETILNHFSLR